MLIVLICFGIRTQVCPKYTFILFPSRTDSTSSHLWNRIDFVEKSHTALRLRLLIHWNFQKVLRKMVHPEIQTLIFWKLLVGFCPSNAQFKALTPWRMILVRNQSLCFSLQIVASSKILKILKLFWFISIFKLKVLSKNKFNFF